MAAAPRSLPGSLLGPLDRRTVPAARAVHQRLRAAVLSLELPPGAPLSEGEIAQRFGVSRTPVREAIGRLVEDGLVTVYPQVGSFVRRIDLDDVFEAQFIREALEVAAVRIAAEVAEPADIDRLHRLVDEQREAAALEDVDAFFVADVGLHNLVFELAGHAGVWQRLRSVGFQMDRVRRLSLPGRHTLAELIAEHSALVDAIARKDSTAAEAGLREHARRVLTYAPELATRYPEYFERPGVAAVDIEGA
jgi:DNA-binding GntR family transcriptional regulator